MDNLFFDFLNKEARFLKIGMTYINFTACVLIFKKKKMNKMFGTILHNTLSILKMIKTLLGLKMKWEMHTCNDDTQNSLLFTCIYNTTCKNTKLLFACMLVAVFSIMSQIYIQKYTKFVLLNI